MSPDNKRSGNAGPDHAAPHNTSPANAGPGHGNGGQPHRPEEPASAEIIVHAHTESAEARIHRISTGVLVAVVGLLLAWLVTITHGTARFALSNALDVHQLGTIRLPGIATVLTCAVVCLLCALGFITGRLVRIGRRTQMAAGGLAGAATIIGFLAWAAAGRQLPFPVANQFAGTLTYATPLVLGALCGVMCENAGVVNVAIEGQMLTGAFAAAFAGSITHSLWAALFAAVLASVAMAAILALFSITYLVDQVVLGVVLNLLASGLTGFLFDQINASPNAQNYNSAPVLPTLSIPGLSKIPFFGSILFEQTGLAYAAFVSVVVVWFLLRRTKWGLRIRSVGEHPQAADTVGISVAAVRWSAVLTGGIFAGLGGAFFTIGSIGQFNKDLTVGNGFIALAALIMGRWRPGLSAVMALFFGFVTQMQSQLQTISTPMPSQFLGMLPYIATIIAVAGLVGRVRAPAADGQPYIK